MFSSRLGCSSISFRHQPLSEALRTMQELGFREIDLGALPGVCDHVPYVLDAAAVEQVAADVQASGLRVRSVNGDVGDLNAVLDEGQRAERADHLDMLLELTAAVGAEALVLPCGALHREPVRSLEEDLRTVAGELAWASRRAAAAGVELWCESLHFFRLCWNEDRARRLADELEGTGVGVVMDFSHVVASGGDPVRFVETFADRITHVHLRDATAGNIHLSIGNGEADFAAGLDALERAGYTGHFSLELETRDVTHDQRPAAARAAAEYISSLLQDPSTITPRSTMSTIQRTAVITGATSEKGIGVTTARRFAREGWGVVILDLDAEKSSQVARSIAAEYGVPAFGHAVDVADEASVTAARDAVAAESATGSLPPVGAVVNIAGITSPVPFLETTLELWHKVMDVNATGTYLVTKAFLPEMIEAGWGRIVNMSSVSAQRGGGVFGKVPYSAAKAAILGFTKALARELGTTGVTVNAVTPGAVDTNIRVGSTDEQEAAIAAGIPVGRTATTEEIAASITFLAAEDSSYLTGVTLDINGGSHMH